VSRWVRALLVALIGPPLALLVPAGPASADDVRDAEWQLTFLDIARVHQINQGDGVTVAVVDTGVDGNHPDLAGNVLQGTSVISGDAGNGWAAELDHGTAMAGLIAAHGHDNAGILGIAPKAKILPFRVGTDARLESTGAVATAIETAAQDGVRVISLSLGSLGGSPALQLAVEHARKADVVVVAAMGNLPKDVRVGCPACYDGVVAVGGVDRNGNHAPTSVTGPQMVVSAPGVDVASTGAHGTYRLGVGTSDATAITAGVVALIRARYPTMSAVDVVHRLTATATDKGPTGRDDQYGYGIVNPYAALTADIPATSPSATGGSPSAASQPSAGNGHGPTSTGILIGLAVIAVIAILVSIGVRRARMIAS
jgi:type VII secretion-associated serine protease mycosin